MLVHGRSCCRAAGMDSRRAGHLTDIGLLHQQGNVTISNDGATIMKKLEIVHPAAKVLVDISLSQDAEVGGCQSSPPPF